MKTRVIQDDPYPSDDGRPSPPGGSPDPGKRGLALRLADWSAANRKKAIWGWLGAVVALFYVLVASGVLEQQSIDTVDTYAGESHEAEQALDDAGLRPTEEFVLVQNADVTADDPAYRGLVEEIGSTLSATRNVENVATPFNGDGGAVSEDGHSVLVDFEITGEDDEVADNVVPSEDALAAIAADNPEYNVEQLGAASSEKALDEIVQGDVGRAGMISLPVTFIVLMITLGALVAAAVPLLLALTAVLATMAIVVVTSQIIPMSDDVNALILLIGLAVGVDYALFYMRREREERAAGRSPEESLRAAARTSGRAVMVSGFTVIIAMSGMLLTGDATFVSFAVATASVVAVMLVAALGVLPAVMAWLGDRVDNGHIPGTRGMRRPAGESRFWSRIVEGAMRRPVLSLVVAGGFLLALAIPGIGLQTVTTGTEDLPRDIEVVQTYDRFTAAFPNEAVAAEVAVAADDVRSGATDDAINQLVADAEASDTFLGGTEVTYSDDATVANVSIPLPGSGTDDESNAALGEVRDDLVPATVGAVEGTTANVTGETARNVDSDELLSSRLPLVFAFVLGLSFLLMLVTFRSIVIPIKAIVLNLLSVFAAYGVLRLVFQEGWGEGLLGFTSNGGITDWLPLFLFVILFGLSMDYHVFILSRVRELYDRGMSTDEAVRRGISGTAGVVTSAALVMVCVFLVFATLSLVDFKELGIGLAAAIFIDATLIRGVLLPASMKVLGDWNWYLPSWLEWLPRIGHGDAPPDPDAEPKTAPAAA